MLRCALIACRSDHGALDAARHTAGLAPHAVLVQFTVLFTVLPLLASLVARGLQLTVFARRFLLMMHVLLAAIIGSVGRHHVVSLPLGDTEDRWFVPRTIALLRCGDERAAACEP